MNTSKNINELRLVVIMIMIVICGLIWASYSSMAQIDELQKKCLQIEHLENRIDKLEKLIQPLMIDRELKQQLDKVNIVADSFGGEPLEEPTDTMKDQAKKIVEQEIQLP